MYHCIGHPPSLRLNAVPVNGQGLDAQNGLLKLHVFVMNRLYICLHWLMLFQD
jgi:hypothetical protein